MFLLAYSIPFMILQFYWLYHNLRYYFSSMIDNVLKLPECGQAMQILRRHQYIPWTMLLKKWLFTLDCPFSSTVIFRRWRNVFLILPPYNIFSSYCSLQCHWCIWCSLSVDVMTLAREFANLSNSEMVNSLWGHLLFLAFSTNHNLLICFHWHYVNLKSRDTQIGWKYIGTAVWTSRRNFSMTSHDYVLFN